MRTIKLLFASRGFVINMSISLALLIALFAVFGFIRYDISVRAQKIQNDRRDLSLRNRSLDLFSLLKNQSAKAAQYQQIIDQKLPGKDDLIGFPTTLDRIGRTHNVEISFAFQQETEPNIAEGRPGIIAFSLVAIGGYRNIADFLEEAQSTSYLVAFDGFDILRDNENFRGVFRGRVFYQ